MGLTAIAHYAVRTSDLQASRRFYVEVLGLREGPRPPFPFPGVWLYLDEDEASLGVVHLIGDGGGLNAYLGDRATTRGSGAVDHLAFFAEDWPAVRHRLEAHRLGFDERVVPDLGLRQVFIEDPAGVVVELNFATPSPA